MTVVATACVDQAKIRITAHRTAMKKTTVAMETANPAKIRITVHRTAKVRCSVVMEYVTDQRMQRTVRKTVEMARSTTSLIACQKHVRLKQPLASQMTNVPNSWSAQSTVILT